MRRNARTLAQIKLDVNASGWPWPIDHPNDERALLDGCRPDIYSAVRVYEFYMDLLQLPAKGGGSEPFILIEWWFRDVLAPLFGWKKPNGLRRFDKAFITTGKKSGKSTVLSALPLYMMMADGEEEAECYSAATSRDQAGIIYRKCASMVRRSPVIHDAVTCVDSQKRIAYVPSASFFQALSSDKDGVEGKNPHLLIADELHVWRDRQYFDGLMYGDIIRDQPLFLMITTAGDDDTTIGFEEYDYAKDLLDTTNEFYSQSHFAFIAEASRDKEWDDPEAWKEANPSLACGALGSIEKHQSRCDEAKKSPAKIRKFRRYICNWWSDAVEDPWLDRDLWDLCGDPIEDHLGEPTWGGLDLSSSRDLTALSLAWWDGDTLDLWWRFWCPGDKVKRFEEQWRVPLRDWIKEGWVVATPGNVVDYAYIRREISGRMLDDQGGVMPELHPDRIVGRYDVKAIGYDPWNAPQLCEKELYERDNVPMIEYRQGLVTMSGACKEFERLVETGRIRHGRNPVATWMSRHCVVYKDAAKNIKPHKTKSRQKIDGIVTAVMATQLAVIREGGPKVDHYETHGPRFL